MAGGVINRCQLISIATGEVRENSPNLLKEYGGDLVLTCKWARQVIGKTYVVKAQRYHQKSRSFPSVFSQRKVHFSEKHISIGFWTRYPPSLIINIDQTPLSYVNTVKYTFSFKGAKNILINGVNDKHQITVTFAVICTGQFFQLIYVGKTEPACPSILFYLLFR